MPEVFIIDSIRTPRGTGKTHGALHEVKPIDLVRVLLEVLRDRNSLDTTQLDDLVLGCVTPVRDQGGNIARAAILASRWSDATPGLTINRLSASGLESVHLAAARIRSGWEHMIVAGGVESMSRIPIGSDGGPLIYDPMISSRARYIPRGISADLMATLEGLSREMVDEYAWLSHSRARKAAAEGAFSKSIVPIRDFNNLMILEEDEYLKQDTSPESLRNLTPAFEDLGKEGFDAVALQKYPYINQINHVHTAGNTSKIVDGAAILLLAGESRLNDLKSKPRARIVGCAVAASDPTIMLMGPVFASEKALKLTGLTPADIDLWEVNESFAAEVLTFQRHFRLSSEQINIYGGAIAMGHPLGASGSIILGNLLDSLEQRGQKRGLAAISAVAGMGVAVIIERTD